MTWISFSILCGGPPEEDGDIFYIDGFDPFLGLNVFGNLRKSWFGLNAEITSLLEIHFLWRMN